LRPDTTNNTMINEILLFEKMNQLIRLDL